MEINRFVSYLREKYPDVLNADGMRTMSDVINVLEKSIVLRSPGDLLLFENHCVCNCPCNRSSTNLEMNVTKNSFRMTHGPLTHENLIQEPLVPGDDNIHLMNLASKTLLPQEFESFSKPLVVSDFLKSFTTVLSPSKSSSLSLLLTESLLPISGFETQTDSQSIQSSFSKRFPSPQSPVQATKFYSDNKELTHVFLSQSKNHVSSETRSPNANISSFSTEDTSLLQMFQTQSATQQLTVPPHFPSDIVSRSGDKMDAAVNKHFMDSPMLTTPLLAADPAGVNTSVHSVQSTIASTDSRTTAAHPWWNIETSFRPILTPFSSKLVHNIHSWTHSNVFNIQEHWNMPMFTPLVLNEAYTLSNVDVYSSISPTKSQSIYKAASKPSDPALLNKMKRMVPNKLPQAHDQPVTSDLKTEDRFKTRTDKGAPGVTILQQQPLMPVPPSTEATGTLNSSQVQKPVSLHDIFVLEINNHIDSFFLVAEFVPERDSVNRTKFIQNTLEYSKIYKASKALHFISLSILSVMVLETVVKLFCTGWAFFKKKFEVFDAFIVISSFALDFVFLDSRWYETGKDATTILVLLLPWRVVRIVNSFLMTMKHKHHLQMMNMKRAKKKAELKSAKLQTLLSEIRKDVQLLVALCKANDIEDKDITACLYGKGRRSVTLSAMSTCTSLMLISTLGKDAIQEDDIYGKIFKEALHEGDISELDVEILQAEEAAIDAAIELDEQLEARRKSRKSKSKKAKVKRSYTVPRRSASVEIPEPDINENSSNVFYINDGYGIPKNNSLHPGNIVVLHNGQEFTNLASAAGACSSVNEEDETQENDLPTGWRLAPLVLASSKQQTAGSVKSGKAKSARSNSMVTFEVTTHVTCL